MALGRGPVAVLCLVVGMGIGFVARPLVVKPTMTKAEKQAAAAAKKKKKATTAPATRAATSKTVMRGKANRIDSGFIPLKSDIIS